MCRQRSKKSKQGALRRSCPLHSPTLHAAKLLITKIALVCYSLKPVLRGSVKAASPKEGTQTCSTLLGCLLASHAKGVVVSQVRHQASLEPASGHHLQPQQVSASCTMMLACCLPVIDTHQACLQAVQAAEVGQRDRQGT